MDQAGAYTRTELYKHLAASKITVGVIDTYVMALVRLGYVKDPYVNNHRVLPADTSKLIRAAERLYMMGDHTRETAMFEVLGSYTENFPDIRVFPGEIPFSQDSLVDTYLNKHERIFLAGFVVLIGVGVLIGISTLAFPQAGFLSVDSLYGTISRITIVNP